MGVAESNAGVAYAASRMVSETQRRTIEAFLDVWSRLTSVERDEIFIRILRLDPQVQPSRIPDVLKARTDAKKVIRQPASFRRDSVA